MRGLWLLGLPLLGAVLVTSSCTSDPSGSDRGDHGKRPDLTVTKGDPEAKKSADGQTLAEAGANTAPIRKSPNRKPAPVADARPEKLAKKKLAETEVADAEAEEKVESAFDSKKWNKAVGMGGGAGGKFGRRGSRRARAKSRRPRAARRLGLRHDERSSEAYHTVTENRFHASTLAPFSTFGVDVDTASYTNVRRYLTGKQLPPKAAVRVEEMVNYFSYAYPQPKGPKPFAVTTEMGICPWNTKHQLVLIGLQGRYLDPEKTPPKNLVFLIDISGSMDSPMKLPLVKKAMKKMVKGLSDRDTVAVVTYAGATGTALAPTRCDNKQPILECLRGLGPGGSTNGAGGIKAAYALAKKNFRKEHVNRVILVTDGDFNVGIASREELKELIEKQRDSGVFLTCVGVGTGNLRDDFMSVLAKHGNGQYIYMDGEAESTKAFEKGLTGTLVTIAKDVKIQVEFNPKRVAGYRLIGYERRVMKKEDFTNDKKDSGEIGAGHSVTALYEVVPVGQEVPDQVVAADASGSQPGGQAGDAAGAKKDKPHVFSAKGDALMLVKLRYKSPWANKSKEVMAPLIRGRSQASDNLEFAGAVAAFGMLLQGSQRCGNASFAMVQELAQKGAGQDKHGLRGEFQKLVSTAGELHKQAKMRKQQGGDKSGGGR